MRMKLFWSLLVSTACICSAANLAAKSDAVDDGFYTSKDKEFYLTPEELIFIRPGLEVEILDVVLPADMQLEVTYTIKDPGGLPLDHTGVTTPGEVSMRFTLAYIPMGEEQKVRLAYERDSRNGTLTQLGPGTYKYKFDYVYAADMDTTNSLVLGFRRDLRDFDLDRYAANDLYIWVPSGMYDAVPRDIVTTDTCNRCHDPLAEHGSRWLSPQACTQCHNATGNTRFDALIHAVHAGTEAGRHDFEGIHYPAPLNACETCHTGGTPTENFPLVANPSAAMVCDMSSVGTTELSWGDLGEFEIHIGSADGPLFVANAGPGSAETGKWVSDGTVFVLVDKATGKTIQELPVNATVLGCVGNAPGAPMGTAAAQNTNWLDHPSRVVCGSCHDDIDFEAGVGHLPFPNDDACHFCHQPGIGQEFDLSVTGAHLELYKSAQFPGALFEFIDIVDTDPGDTPTVTFSLTSKTGTLNPNEMNRLRLAITGPNEDFDVYIQENVANAVPVGNFWSYTFATPIPADAVGSYTVSVEGRATATIEMLDGPSTERDLIEASLMAFAVTDSAAESRRVVVDDEKCESCHVNLSLHGGGRNNADYCTTCHAPNETDWEELLPGAEEQSIHFKYMIHKIHRGAELENGYVVAGHNQSVHDYGDVHYPGDLRNCEGCHVDGSQQIDLPDGVLPTVTPQEWWMPMDPVAAACVGCHDSDNSAAHMYSNTAEFGEACGTCHGEGKSAAVDKVHAR